MRAQCTEPPRTLGRNPRSNSKSPFVLDRNCARLASCAAGVHQRSSGCATGHYAARHSPRKPSSCSTSISILLGGPMRCRCSLPAALTRHHCCTGARTLTSSTAARMPSPVAAPPGCQGRRPCFHRRSDDVGFWASALPHRELTHQRQPA